MKAPYLDTLHAVIVVLAARLLNRKPLAYNNKNVLFLWKYQFWTYNFVWSARLGVARKKILTTKIPKLVPKCFVDVHLWYQVIISRNTFRFWFHKTFRSQVLENKTHVSDFQNFFAFSGNVLKNSLECSFSCIFLTLGTVQGSKKRFEYNFLKLSTVLCIKRW